MNELEVKPPARLPNRSTSLVFHGLKYQGAIFDLTIDNKMYHLNVRALNINSSIIRMYDHQQQHGILKINDLLSFSVDTRLTIRPQTPLCS